MRLGLGWYQFESCQIIVGAQPWIGKREQDRTGRWRRRAPSMSVVMGKKADRWVQMRVVATLVLGRRGNSLLIVPDFFSEAIN